MKKILAIFALMIITTVLASCGANKEGSKAEEGSESANVQATEKTSPNKIEVKTTVKKDTKNEIKTVNSNSTGSEIMSGSTSTGKTEDQVVKDFEKQLDGLFKLLESDAQK